MKAVSDILLVQGQAVGRVALELVADLLGRVEFRGEFRQRDTYLLPGLGRRGDGDGEYRTRNAE
jgi:hypothetical protein